MAVSDARIEVKIRMSVYPCEACAVLYRQGVEHVRDRALAFGGQAHLYLIAGQALCGVEA